MADAFDAAMGNLGDTPSASSAAGMVPSNYVPQPASVPSARYATSSTGGVTTSVVNGTEPGPGTPNDLLDIIQGALQTAQAEDWQMIPIQRLRHQVAQGENQGDCCPCTGQQSGHKIRAVIMLSIALILGIAAVATPQLFEMTMQGSRNGYSYTPDYDLQFGIWYLEVQQTGYTADSETAAENCDFPLLADFLVRSGNLTMTTECLEALSTKCEATQAFSIIGPIAIFLALLGFTYGERWCGSCGCRHCEKQGAKILSAMLAALGSLSFCIVFAIAAANHDNPTDGTSGCGFGLASRTIHGSASVNGGFVTYAASFWIYVAAFVVSLLGTISTMAMPGGN